MSTRSVQSSPITVHGKFILKTTPFFLVPSQGVHPLTSASVSSPRKVPCAHDFVEGIEKAAERERAKKELQAALSPPPLQVVWLKGVSAHQRENKLFG